MSTYSLLTAIASYVAVNSYGILGGTDANLFVEIMPEEPVTCTAIMPTPSPYFRGHPLHRKGFAILHRRPKTDVDAGATFVNSLHSLFDNQWNRLDLEHLGRSVPMSEPGPPVQDEAGNIVWIRNYMYFVIE